MQQAQKAVDMEKLENWLEKIFPKVV